ncbi:hypothetical protein JYG34_24620 [Pseudomonas entomophila]|uniref:hypothetical protein n=1 Tax=Pseudomonas entomophila TaxID=312306 RepID=UPI001BCFAC4B|nr:hypothetical protein [Pseudomonas entomophila]QVM91147.1 hypothetical protein JYG34_24620 [Pseudomonas entomophila]
MQFVKVSLWFVVLPAVLGGICGTLYHFGILKDDGLWVDLLDLVAGVFLDKFTFVVELLLAGYLLVWSFFGKMEGVSKWGRLLAVKCFLGLVVIPAFILVAGPLIPALSVALVSAFELFVMGYILAAVSYWWLLHKAPVACNPATL